MVDIRDKNALWQFAWIPKYKDYPSYIEQLKDLIIDEKWSSPDFDDEDFNEKYLDEKYPLLDIYLRYTYRKLKQDYDKAPDDQKSAIISMSDDYAVFNTGLFTRQDYKPVYMCFDRNRKPDKQPWHFKEFFAATLPGYMEGLKLPERANYFVEPEKLIYDYNLPIKLNTKHIIEDNRVRFPKELRDKYNTVELFKKLKPAISRTEKKLADNCKLAVPQYYFEAEDVQLLVPIDLEDRGKVDIVLPITKDSENHYYFARTCLTLPTAYSNARLIVKPESDWLHL